MLQALTDNSSLIDTGPSTPWSLSSAGIGMAPGVGSAVERMPGASQCGHTEAFNPYRRAGARDPVHDPAVVSAARAVVSPTHDDRQFAGIRQALGVRMGVVDRLLDMASITGSDVIVHGEQIARFGGNCGVRVDEPETAKPPAPGEPDHPGNRRVVADRIGSGSVEEHPRQDEPVPVPDSLKPIAVASTAGKDGVASGNFHWDRTQRFMKIARAVGYHSNRPSEAKGNMKGYAARAICSALALWFVSTAVPGISVSGAGVWLTCALAVGLSNGWTRTVIVFYILPLRMATIAGLSLAINAAVLAVPAILLEGVAIGGAVAAVVGWLAMSGLATAVTLYVGPDATLYPLIPATRRQSAR